MNQLIACYISRDDLDFWFKDSLQSVLSIVEKVVVVVDKPSKELLEMVDGLRDKKIVILRNKYLHDSKCADGLQRQVYLDYLMTHYDGSYGLVLDTDEILGDNVVELNNFLSAGPFGAWSLRMRHLFFSFGFEDATLEKHFVPLRLFKIKKGLSYPAVEHPILQGYNLEECKVLDLVNVWHFGSLQGMPSEILKWEKQCWKSNIHTPEMLNHWKNMHLFGSMPLKVVNAEELPFCVKRRLKIV